MKKKFEVVYNDKYIRQLANHFADIPGYWVQEEIEDFDIIHDTDKEKIQELLKRDSVDGEDLENWDCNDEGGVYCILFPGIKSVYIGETFNLKRRFKEHYTCLNDRDKYKGKMLKAYERNGKQCKFIVLEHGKVMDWTKAEFKLYCMKRENYYKEVFHNNGYGLYNQEDTLSTFYKALDDLHEHIRLDPCVVRNKYRIHSMDDLKELETRTELKKREQRRYELFSEALEKRFAIRMKMN